jgi:hypothetical protein
MKGRMTMTKTKLLLLMLAGLFLTACETAPTRWVPLSWAKVSFEQASAECYAHINSLAGLGQSYYLCMKAKGWEETRY